MCNLKSIVSPSVLASDFSQLGAECSRVMKDGAEWVHMDVMDGHFVPNITFGPPVLQSVSKSVKDIKMDCHMMVSDPEAWIEDVKNAGGYSYTFHYEATDDPVRVTKKIRAAGMKAAIAISPKTDSEVITSQLVESGLDMILVMTVEPGKGGQKFMPNCLQKVRDLRQRFPNLDIQVDGGVSQATVGACAEAGANIVVAGSAVFCSEDPGQVIQSLKSALESSQ